MSRHRVLNAPAIRRMPIYYHKLILMKNAGEKYVSTSKLAKYVNLDPIVVRKDFELTGVNGSRGVGYQIDSSIEAIRTYLGWDKWTRACLIGAGALGTALLGFHEFAEYGLNICKVFDSSTQIIGKEIYCRLVENVADMDKSLSKEPVEMAILCVPAKAAQHVAEQLVACGINLIWNFSNVCLQLPPHVVVQREIIAGGYALLARKRKEHCLNEYDGC